MLNKLFKKIKNAAFNTHWNMTSHIIGLSLKTVCHNVTNGNVITLCAVSQEGDNIIYIIEYI